METKTKIEVGPYLRGRSLIITRGATDKWGGGRRIQTPSDRGGHRIPYDLLTTLLVIINEHPLTHRDL